MNAVGTAAKRLSTAYPNLLGQEVPQLSLDYGIIQEFADS